LRLLISRDPQRRYHEGFRCLFAYLPHPAAQLDVRPITTIAAPKKCAEDLVTGTSPRTAMRTGVASTTIRLAARVRRHTTYDLPLLRPPSTIPVPRHINWRYEIMAQPDVPSPITCPGCPSMSLWHVRLSNTACCVQPRWSCYILC
jgi:hypothetical protein